MANGTSLFKLKVDTSEYDPNLKKAAEGIQHLAKRIHDSQGAFEGLDDDVKNFIKDMQYMSTSSKTSAGQLRELETAYKGLQAMYNQFNAFEKSSEEGKLLAEQLEILKQRTLDARQAMSDANKGLEEHGSFLDRLASRFTVNIDAMKLFDIGLKATESALSVARDAFMASEGNVDEWNRIIASSEAVYNGFLTALNNGDFSGYLDHIDEIVQAARAAYNELDKLGTMRTIQGPE